MEGLFFFFLVTCMTGASTLVSREKEKEVPRVREKLKAWPWLASVWQKARHWVPGYLGAWVPGDVVSFK